MTFSTVTRRVVDRLAIGLLMASLAMGVFGAAGTSAATTYSTATSMILNNVPRADLIANTRGICNGSFNIVVANVGSATGARAYLDAVQACGLKAVLFFSTTSTPSGTVYPSRVGPQVRAVMNHPALYGYLSVKEPSGTHVSATEIRSMYKAFKTADPSHPVVALFGDIPHFGDHQNPYTARMADIVMVDWYPVETTRGGCARTGTTYIANGPKWFKTKVRPVVAAKTPGVKIWVMVQTHKYLAPSCHKKQRPNWTLLTRQVREALQYAGASGIAFHTFSNANYAMDQRRDATMVTWMKAISGKVRAGTF